MFKTIIRQIAGLQIILGLIMMVPLLVSCIYREWYSCLGFGVSGMIVAGTGFILYKILQGTPEPQYKHALIIAAGGWLMIMIAGALPYFLIAHLTPFHVMQGYVPIGYEYLSSLINFKNPLHAFFESTSAFTTTGLTMAVHEPSIGRGVLFYRSLSQWVGGAGFIVMSLAIFQQLPGQGAMLLYGSESSAEKLKSNVIDTAKAIWKVYFWITLIMTVYLFTGTYFILPSYPLENNLFDAINHAMAGQSTGGFSTLDDSIAGYQSPEMDLLHILPMLVGALSIPFLFRVLFQGKFNEFWHDIQARALFIACILGSAVLSLLLIRADIVSQPFREGTFQFVSALSTTGWQTSNINAWDDLSVLFIVATAMIVGGCAGATVGGIKVIRAVLLLKGLRWQVNKVFFTRNAIKTVRFNHKRMLPSEMNKQLARVGVFTLLYLIFVFVSTMISLWLMGDGHTLADAIFESASAQGTVGLSNGITDPDMSPVLECVYIFQMWTGRLEIIPVLVLIHAIVIGTRPRII